MPEKYRLGVVMDTGRSGYSTRQCTNPVTVIDVTTRTGFSLVQCTRCTRFSGFDNVATKRPRVPLILALIIWVYITTDNESTRHLKQSRGVKELSR